MLASLEYLFATACVPAPDTAPHSSDETCGKLEGFKAIAGVALAGGDGVGEPNGCGRSCCQWLSQESQVHEGGISDSA